jgi:signal transduction histidine kinase
MRAITQHIEQTRERIRRVELGVNIVSAIVAIAVGFAALRTWQLRHRHLEALAEVERARAVELDRFVGRVAHDIRGPLTAARVSIGSAVEETPDPAQRQRLERGDRSLARLSLIVDGLLHFARAGGKPEPGTATDVAPLIEGLVEELQPFAEQQRVEVRVVPFPPTVVACDRGALWVVLDNLVRNAIKFMGERPEQLVTLRVIDGPSPSIVRFEVKDTGPGIPAASLERVWQAFFREHPERTTGMGLGLATVKRIVTGYGGQTGVESTVGDGSLFWFELPRSLATS